jgi:hypothetical protein
VTPDNRLILWRIRYNETPEQLLDVPEVSNDAAADFAGRERGPRPLFDAWRGSPWTTARRC